MSAKEEPEREDRILMQIVVDAYDESERAMGWYCYLGDTLKFPFDAVCIARRSTSQLRPKQRVRVLGMADSDDCLHDMFVTIRWSGDDDDEDDDDELAVPLSQLRPVSRHEKTKEAVGDWHYWVVRGYQF